MEGSDDEIGKGLIVNNALFDSLADCHFNGLTIASLVVSGEEGEDLVFIVLEFGEGLVLWVNEVLNFGEGEFSDSEETRSGGDFVSETETDLGTTEGNTTTVVFEEVSEVDEHTLGSFRSEVTLGVTSGTDLNTEHEVKLVRVAEAVTSFGGLDAEGLDNTADFLEFVVGKVLFNSLEFFTLLLGELLVLGENVFDVLGG